MTADIVALNVTRTTREQTDIGWRLLRGQDNPFLTKVAAAGQNASALGLTSTIAKIDWGKHRIWSSLFVSPDRVSASPGIGSRYGQREHQSSALFLTGEWYKTAEFFSTDLGAEAKLMNLTDALMDHLFRETPAVLDHLAKEKYDPINCVRLLEFLRNNGIEPSNEIGMRRAFQHVESMRERIRSAFVLCKEDFADPIRE